MTVDANSRRGILRMKTNYQVEGYAKVLLDWVQWASYPL